jgi:hypothetical protein
MAEKSLTHNQIKQKKQFREKRKTSFSFDYRGFFFKSGTGKN